MAHNFDFLDLNLLPLLLAVEEKRSVVAAGAQLGISSGAVHRGIAELRLYFGDQLFERGSLTPTQRCQDLCAALRPLLMSLVRVVG